MRIASHIMDLSSGRFAEAKLFGRKARNLSRVQKNNFAIPQGFAISTELCRLICSSSRKEKYIRLLATYVRKLISNSKTKKMIVRSSSRHENGFGGQFSGLFDSYSGILTTEEVVLAIEKIVRNSKNFGLHPYFKHVGVKQSKEHMAVIVQDQISPEISGIASFANGSGYIDVTEGHLVGIVSGSENSTSVVLNINNVGNYELLPTQESTQKTNFTLDALKSLDLEGLAKSFDGKVIEFGIVDGQLIILQVNEGGTLEPFVPNNAISIPGWFRLAENSGSKAKAMGFFRSVGLFKKPLEIIASGTLFNEAAKIVAKVFGESEKVTIRFSKGNEIGLPRCFATSLEEALLFLQTHYQRDYTTIVHGFVEVARSFEMLIGDDFSLLEHVPGMWESNSQLLPDVILLRGGEATTHRVVHTRDFSTIGHDSDKFGQFGAPLSDEELLYFTNMLETVRETLIRSPEIRFPINVHAIYDAESNEYHCINIREGFDLEHSPLRSPAFHRVTSESDLDTWDGISSIQLTLRTERGDESSLIGLAQRLSKLNVPLIVDFGLLSHPAMILRDFGCKLIPSYQIDLLPENSSYEKKTVKYDAAHDAFFRIISESQLAESSDYHVVMDRDPIAEVHYLCVGKSFSPSTADTRKLIEVQRLFRSLSRTGVTMFYYERGRAAFCTSGFSYAQDHFHLVEGLNVDDVHRRLHVRIGGVTYQSLQEAYVNVPENGEYCVYGSAETGFTVAHGKIFGKRLFREVAQEKETKRSKIQKSFCASNREIEHG